MSYKARVLIVDDDANTLGSLARAFRLAGHQATVCDNARQALEQIKSEGVMTPVVMMSGQAHIEMAVRATRLGALDFLEKPLSTDKLLLTLQNALRLERLEQENRQ